MIAVVARTWHDCMAPLSDSDSSIVAVGARLGDGAGGKAGDGAGGEADGEGEGEGEGLGD